MDLDEYIAPTEVAEAIAAAGSWSEIKIGDIRRTAAQLAAVWIRGSLAAFTRAVQRVQVDWAARAP